MFFFDEIILLQTVDIYARIVKWRREVALAKSNAILYL